MTNYRIENIRTILFDAGNTLVYVDLTRVAEVLAEAGIRRRVEELIPAEAGARTRMYLHFEGDPKGGDRSRWEVYVDEMLLRVDITEPELCQRVRTSLFERHQRDNLWRHVPRGIPSVLDELRARGFRLGVVSNSDGRVEELLRSVDLADRFEAIVDSCLVGVEKPDPRIFRIALKRLEERPDSAVYVGDFPAVDVAGARAAGLTPVLLDPGGSLSPRGCRTITRLTELPAILPERPSAPPGG